MPAAFAELKAKSLKLKAIRAAKRGSMTIFFHKDFSHDILCISRSDDNRRAAGAVEFSTCKIHYNQTIFSED